MVLVNISKKEKAIDLRKEGKTYSEILKEIPVAKSTLSEWFRDVSLSKKQTQKLTLKKLEAARRGGRAKRAQRIERTQEIYTKALADIKNITKRELWLIGVVLYWAEGTKEKEYRPGSGINFNNSDPRMIKLFIKWLLESCDIDKSRIGFEIYIHENSKNNVASVREFWSQVSGFPLGCFSKVYFKKINIKTNRSNTGDLYYGLLRVKVRASSVLLRQITGWTEAIVRRIK